MREDGASGRTKVWAAAPAIMVVAALALFPSGGTRAQSIMRSPSLNIGARIPTVTPGGVTSVNPGIAVGSGAVTNVGRTATNVGRSVTAVRPPPRLKPRLAVPHLPYLYTLPNLYPACDAAYRDSNGDCLSEVETTVAARGDSGASTGNGRGQGSRRNAAQIAAGLAGPAVANEVVAEIGAALTDAQTDELARRHGLRRIERQTFPLIDATIALFRITDGRSVATTSRELATDDSFRSVQANFRYWLQEQMPAAKAEELPQYVLPKLRLPEAHKLVDGADVTVAVIDSGIDIRHPELANSIADSFDALGNGEGAHLHGTAIAGAIVAHARLTGSAPAARVLAIRAFGAAASGAQSSSFVILKGMNYAAEHGARIVNMSFAGPRDALVERGVAALGSRNIVMVAAAGNAGAKSPPLYPAAYPGVIAVSATDAEDRLFPASNRGSYVAVAAPGVDVLLPAPQQKYQITSGTSFSAAYVSGVAALVLERNPAMKPEELRATLVKTARDLGSPGRDELFGAGEADAYAAVEAATPAAPSPVVASEPAKRANEAPAAQIENASESSEGAVDHTPAPPVANTASDKSAAVGADR